MASPLDPFLKPKGSATTHTRPCENCLSPKPKPKPKPIPNPSECFPPTPNATPKPYPLLQLCYKYVRVDDRELKRRCARYLNPLLGDDHGLISFDEVKLTFYSFFFFPLLFLSPAPLAHILHYD